MSDQPSSYRTSDRRVIPWLLFGLVVLFGALYVAGYYVTSDRIPRGTTVSGIEVGGLTPAAATAKLRVGLDGRAAERIPVSANGERASVTPATAGIGVDVPATVALAGGGRSWDPVRMWEYYVGGTAVSPVVAVDRTALAAAVARIADQVDVPATEGRVTFAGGEADPTYPHKGIVVDRPAAARAVRDAFLHDRTTVDLPTRDAEPTVTKAAVSRAMDGFANPAVSGPVVVSLDGEGVEVQPEEFGPALSMTPQGTELRPTLDARALMAVLGPRLHSLTRPARDASYRIVGGRPVVVPARTGLGFDTADVTGRFLDVLTRTGAARTLVARPVAVPPAVATDVATGLGITERVASFTTHYPTGSGRDAGLAQAARAVDGTLLQPGQTFSLDEALGQRAGADGQLVGGGTELATALFNAAFLAGLELVAHTTPPEHVAGSPLGREALADLTGADLRIRNDSRYGVYLGAGTRPGAVDVAVYSTRRFTVAAQQSACTPDQAGGVEVDVDRLLRRPGSTAPARRETVRSRYRSAAGIACS